MTFDQLEAIGKTALTDVETTPVGLPAPLAYVLLSEQGHLYTVINDDFHPVIQALREAQDTVILKCLAMGIDTLYLSTDHASFYERYGWEFYCMAQEEGSDCLTRMYRKITR